MRKLALPRWAGPGLFTIVLLTGAPAARAAESATGTAWLGVSTQALTSELREALSYKGPGALVNRVVEDSPADSAGIRKGDVITAIGQKAVADDEDLTRQIRALKPGQKVTVKVLRAGKTQTLNARLGERSEEEDAPEVIIDGDLGELEDLPHRIMDDPGMRKLMRDTRVMVSGRGRLGVRVEDLNEELGGYFSRDKGALVLEVTEDTPAEKAGIKAGDVITRVGDDAVESTSDLIAALRGKEGKVTIELYRKGARRTVEAELEAGKTKTVRIRAPRGPGGHMWHDDGAAPRVWIDGGSNQDLEKEMRRLRDEMQKLREELNTMKKNK